MIPLNRATARDRPYYTRPGKAVHPYIVGAGLSPSCSIALLVSFASKVTETCVLPEQDYRFCTQMSPLSVFKRNNRAMNSFSFPILFYVNRLLFPGAGSRIAPR